MTRITELGGAVTGDSAERINANYCLAHDQRDNLRDSLAPLDAPDWLPTGRIVCYPGYRPHAELERREELFGA